MRLFVISDTHGKWSRAVDIYKRLTDIDAIIHLGDFKSDAKSIQRILGTEVIAVGGNMDGARGPEAYRIFPTEYGHILLTHGHTDHVKSGVQGLLYRAEELGCKAALFGHTHKPLFEEADGIYLINPGSLTLPYGGGQGSYAIVTLDETSLSCTILYDNLTTNLPPEKKPERVKGGYLRDLLNNSDRF